MPMWGQILTGIMLVAMLVLLWPSAKQMLEESRQAENPDWQGALFAIGGVVLFVVLLIAMSRA